MNKNIIDNNINVFSQTQLEKYYNYKMDDGEIEKTNNIKLPASYKARLIYVNNLGYLVVSKGYLILKDGTEQTCYFKDSLYPTMNLQLVQQTITKSMSK